MSRSGCSQGCLRLGQAPSSLVLWWVFTLRPKRGDFGCDVQLPPAAGTGPGCAHPCRSGCGFKGSWFGNGFHAQSE